MSLTFLYVFLHSVMAIVCEENETSVCALGVIKIITSFTFDSTFLRIFFQWLHSPSGPWQLLFQFPNLTRAVELLERVISSSQGLYLNTQHKHRKTHIHTIKHPCP
jgi:hypothetical protein